MPFKVWVKAHKRETAAGSLLVGIGVLSLAIYFIFFHGETKVSKPVKDESTSGGETPSSSGSGDGTDASPSPQVEEGKGRTPGDRPVPLNNPKNIENGEHLKNTENGENLKNTENGGENHSHENNYPCGILTDSPKPTSSPKSSVAPNPSGTKKSAEQLQIDLKNSEKVEESHDFTSILDSFEKSALNFKPSVPAAASGGTTTKPLSAFDSQKAHIAQVFSLHPSLKLSDVDSPFEKAHKKVFDLLSNALLRESCDPNDLQMLNDSVAAAKLEAEKVTDSNEKAPFYKDVSTIKEYVSKSVQFGKLLRNLVGILLTEGQSPLFENVLELLFHCVHLLDMFKSPQNWLKPMVNLSDDYGGQRQAILSELFQLLNFRDQFVGYLEFEFSKSAPDRPKLQKMIDNWVAVKPDFPIKIKNTFEIFPSVEVDNVQDMNTARLFCYQQFLHNNLISYFGSQDIKMTEVNRAYAEIRKELAPASIITSKSDFQGIIEAYTPAPFLPINQAVLGGKPYRCNLPLPTARYTSSILQTITNFLPLFQKLTGIDSIESNTFSKNVLQILRNMATQEVSYPDFTINTHQNPTPILREFLSGFPDQGFSLIKACGLAPNHLYYPPVMAYFGQNPVEEASQVSAIGPLFIYIFNQRPGESFPMEDVPLQLSMNVLGIKERKTYELYSIIFGISNVNTVSYVKRADRQWYNTDYQQEPAKVAISSIPLQKTNQSRSQFPLMAFYLRTEA